MQQVIRGLLIGTMCVTGLGCAKATDDRIVEAKRQVLRGSDLTETRKQALAEQQITGDNGELLSSNVVVAGITIPRGFEPKFVFEHEWHYDGQVPLDRLANYFRAQLDATVEQPNPYSVVFAQATARTSNKGTNAMAPVRVKIVRVPGREGWSRIQILAAADSTAQKSTPMQADLTVGRHSTE
jgi:hypothetical protein